MIGTGVVDAGLEPGDFDFSSAERWHVLVLYDGAPAARVDLPSPGTVERGELVDAVLRRRADSEGARRELIARLRHRLGEDPGEHTQPSVSVVVCTHRRARYLSDLLGAIAQLDPAPFEVIVVDNDPGAESCRERVEGAGLRYVREDRRGLDNARNAGLRAARGDIVAFVDDDCVVPPAWLAPLARAFAEESVAAVTGPAFPYVLDTPARERMERQASLARGLRRESFDWQVISPLHAAAMGVGANMAIRRDRLRGLGDPFPAELDAGTETESGGDTYLLSRLLAAGGRVVYEPESFVFHQHRDDAPALRKAVLGYGIGLSAALTKLVVEERELSAPRAWAWLVKQYLRTQRRRLVGRADAAQTRLSWEYLRGGFLGAGRWRRALHSQNAASNGGEPAAQAAAALAESQGSSGQSPVAETAELEISVVIPTYRREQALRRCLAALADQDVPHGCFEVIVVDDDDRPGEPEPLPSHPFPLRRVRNGGEGSAAARNHGAREARAPLVLFLDDDVVADRWLLRHHLRWHVDREPGGVLVGPYWPKPTGDNFTAAVARLWWFDFFELLDEAQGMTFVSALTANMSMPRSVFAAVGGFSEAHSRQRREDWEWGLRARRAGVPLVFDRGASAAHEFTLDTEQRLRDAHREGFGDALIAARYPEALSTLPLSRLQRRTPLRWAAFHLWCWKAVRSCFIALLDALESARMRQLWVRGYELAQGLSYSRGALAGGWDAGSADALETFDLELLGRGPIEAPAVAAQLVRVTLGGEEIARVLPREGVWAPSLAGQIVDALEPKDVLRAATLGNWLEEGASPRGLDDVEVIFGPASPPSDLSNSGQFEQLGATVSMAEGEASHHTAAVKAAIRAGTRPLVALPFAGTCPQPAWLADALSAFDGSRVGIVFGGAMPPGQPADPLYLHDRHSADPALALAGAAPAYLVMRRELALELPDSGDAPAVAMAALDDALKRGWVIGHRDARGLRAPTYGERERGEAYGRHEGEAALRLDRDRRPRAVAKGLSRGFFVLAWALLKHRGRLPHEERELAIGIARGAAGRMLTGRSPARR